MVLTIDLSNQAILEVTKGIYKDALAMKTEEVSKIVLVQVMQVNILAYWRARDLHVSMVWWK